MEDTLYEEKVLKSQPIEIIDKADLNGSSLEKKLEAEIERHKKFHSGIMGRTDSEYTAKDVGVRNYAKYLLHEGKDVEKRELLGCLRGKICLQEKTVSLE